jgi:hypothetical protein
MNLRLAGLLLLLLALCAGPVACGQTGSQEVDITVTHTVVSGGVCGQPPFDGSRCPPLPAGTSNWVYIGGDEYNSGTTLDFSSGGSNIYQYTDPVGTNSSGAGCQILGSHVFITGGFLHLTSADPTVDCAVQPPYIDGGGCHTVGGLPANVPCGGPSVAVCIQAPDPNCLTTNPGGIYLEARMTSNGDVAYNAGLWTESVNGCDSGIAGGGIEVDINEASHGGDFSNLLWGGYGGNPTDCPQGADPHPPLSDITLTDGFHLIGARYVSGDSIQIWHDGHLFYTFTNGVPNFVGIIYMYSWGAPGESSGELVYDWLRVYRAE